MKITGVSFNVANADLMCVERVYLAKLSCNCGILKNQYMFEESRTLWL